ncbi:zinc finger BED domain-containing protein RICESLEEPER 2-like protein [Tanacetum coccineum]|uniref:Zinc finger BED domain-containing protein RICESLEEPER 2-like protein n=1 Tax=Tanacetum coccineum TaxID=301880 RepID=A0ABQ4YM66_9ASTR
MSRQSMEGDNEDDASSATSMKDRSLVWSCFEKIEGATPADRKATCHNCGKVYCAKPSSGTRNLKRHMLKCFNFEEGGPPQKRAPLDQDMYRVTRAPYPSASAWAVHSGKIGKVRWVLGQNRVTFWVDEKFWEKMAIAIIKHNYPFSYVEHEATRQLHKFLHRDAAPICRNSAKKDVIAIYEREKTKLKAMLEKVSSRISFTADLWSSITNDGYMALTAHYVDETWVLRKKVLNFRIVPPPHSGKMLASVLFCVVAGYYGSTVQGEKLINYGFQNLKLEDDTSRQRMKNANAEVRYRSSVVASSSAEALLCHFVDWLDLEDEKDEMEEELSENLEAYIRR